jgi:outer membrane protein assembly factor BamB
MRNLTVSIKHFGDLSALLALVARLALCLGALAVSMLMPPVIDFRAQPLAALALSLVGAALLLAPAIGSRRLMKMKPQRRLKSAPRAPLAPQRPGGTAGKSDASVPQGHPGRRPLAPILIGERWGGRETTRIAAQIAGFLLLWGVIGWAVFSQPAPLDRELALVLALRALPVVALAGLAAVLLVLTAWQRRALLALALPSLLAVSFVATITPPQVLDFRPYWLAVDGRGTLYVTDGESPVIRVFSPDGTLQAKLRPRQAVLRGVPGIGFSPPGPWNDPDNLGVPGLTGQSQSKYGWLRPWAPNTDEFLFCGLAVDSQNRLYVLDWLGNHLLRFTPDGWMDAIWPLPKDYQPTTGCLALSQGRLYVADQRGSVLTYDLDGHLLNTLPLPGQPTGISVDQVGHLYALIGNSIWRETLSSQATLHWNLPPPHGMLGFPYETLLALNGDQVLVSDLNTQRIWRFSGEGRVLGWLGGAGNQPGQFAGIGGLARGSDGQLYVTDFDHRVVQRFSATGAIDGLYRGPDDDEND